MIHPFGLSLALALTVLAAWAMTGAARRYAIRSGVLDIPNSRSSHLIPTARGGGLAIVLVYFAALLFLLWLRLLDTATVAALVLGGGVVAAVGYLDDRQALSASVRFSVHALAAVWVVVCLGGIPDGMLRTFGFHGILAGSVLAILALTWMTNLFNFMDGIDGIAASEAAFIACAGAFISWRHGVDAGLAGALLALGGASVGFLIWNWPPAKIFMGDVGSGFLGFSLAALGVAVSARSAVPIEVWVILGGVFLIDATLTLLRRMLRGERWYEAHRTHAYQRLARRWNAHLPVTAGVIAIDVAWLFPWACLAANLRPQAPYFMAAALAPLIALAVLSGAGSGQE
jgi:Fuc2NAc and GlcNAc transferase